MAEQSKEQNQNPLELPASLKEQIEARQESNLLKMIQFIGKAHSLSDGELIDEIYEHVMSDKSLISYEYALLEALLMRFQTAINLETTPKCIYANGEPTWADVIGNE